MSLSKDFAIGGCVGLISFLMRELDSGTVFSSQTMNVSPANACKRC